MGLDRQVCRQLHNANRILIMCMCVMFEYIANVIRQKERERGS